MNKYFYLIATFIFFSNVTVYSQVNLNTGLIGCYPFNNSSQDYSGLNHHGTVSGATLTTDRFGVANNAYYFDGIDDYINLGMLDQITSSQEFSFSVWVEPVMVKKQSILMLMPDSFQDRLLATVYYDHGSQSYTFWDFGNSAAGGRLSTPNTVFSNLWQHYVFTVHPVNGMNVYKNGVLESSDSASASLLNRARELWIGGGIDHAGDLFYWLGKIDDIRIYERELDSNEVVSLYNMNVICSPVSLSEETNIENNYSVSIQGNELLISVAAHGASAELKLYSIDGKLILNSGKLMPGETVHLQIPHPSTGVYLYSIQSDLATSSGRLLLTRL
jgi:hypothetical protein